MVDKVLEKTELAGYFSSQHRVTAEDEPYDDYRGYMLVSEGFFSPLNLPDSGGSASSHGCVGSLGDKPNAGGFE